MTSIIYLPSPLTQLPSSPSSCTTSWLTAIFTKRPKSTSTRDLEKIILVAIFFFQIIADLHVQFSFYYVAHYEDNFIIAKTNSCEEEYQIRKNIWKQWQCIQFMCSVHISRHRERVNTHVKKWNLLFGRACVWRDCHNVCIFDTLKKWTGSNNKKKTFYQ